MSYKSFLVLRRLFLFYAILWPIEWLVKHPHSLIITIFVFEKGNFGFLPGSCHSLLTLYLLYYGIIWCF